MTDDINAAASATAPNSLREDLEEAWDRLSADAEEPEPEEEDVPGEVEVEVEDEPPAPEDGDPGGEDLAPLEHWPAEWRERFEALPEDARGYALDLHRRFEQAHSERSQSLAEREKELDGFAAIDAALAPWRETMRAQGLTDADAVNRLMEAQAALENDPEASLAAIAEAYGVAPSAAPAAPAPPERRDEMLDTLERYAAEQHELRLIAAMESELDARARIVDAAGEPRFPHFDSVRPRLAALMRSGAADSFEDAYQQAVWADPHLRQKALEARDAEMAARRESARKAEVAKARNAGRAALSGSEPARSALPPARSHREELERVWDRMVGA